MLKFEPVDHLSMAGRLVFTGPNPATEAEDIRTFTGRHVQIEDDVYVIIDVEHFATAMPPGNGDPIGLMVELVK